MPPKQRAVRIESKSAMSAMQQLEHKSDEELHAETRFRSAAQAILGARAAERSDAKAAREHFRVAIAAARPQERLQLRRMAEASLAYAERRMGDLKVAQERLGQAPPTGRQMLVLRILALVDPGRGAPTWRRVAGVLLVIAVVLLLLLVGWALVKLIGLPFGGVDSGIAIFYGFVLVLIALGTLFVLGRRRQKAARAGSAPARR